MVLAPTFASGSAAEASGQAVKALFEHTSSDAGVKAVGGMGNWRGDRQILPPQRSRSPPARRP